MHSGCAFLVAMSVFVRQTNRIVSGHPNTLPTRRINTVSRPLYDDPRKTAKMVAFSRRHSRFATMSRALFPRPVYQEVPVQPAPHATDASREEAKLTDEEWMQLTFVNYVEELEKAKSVTLTDLLSKFTHLKDVSSTYLDDADFDGYIEKEDSSSSGSSSLVS